MATIYTTEYAAARLGWHERKVQRVAALMGHDRRVGHALVFFSKAEIDRLAKWKPQKRGPKPKPATT